MTVELVKSPFCLNQGRLVGRIKGRRELHQGGRNCVKYLKRGWNRKEGRGNKKFLKGRQAGSRDGCLKKDGGFKL